VLSSGAIDMLGLITTDWAKLRLWGSGPEALDASDLSAIRTSGIAAFHPAVNLPGRNPAGPTARWLDGWTRFCSHHPSAFLLVRTAADLDLVSAAGPAGILLGVQNSTHFSTVDDVRRFAAIGQRVSQLTYNGPNRLGSGCYSTADRGLTEFGAAIVNAMNSEGMLIDVSHCGTRTTLDAVQASSRPVVATHSNCQALTPGEARCKSDEVIQRIAARGGVIGMTAIRKFVAPRGQASLDDMLDHFDHAARLVGVDHLGIGSDADLEGRQPVIPELAHGQFLYAITDGLLRRGYTSAEITAILAGNFRRVLRQTLPAPS
jgi:membrane dipeptidase